jgi:outer membrane protein assembly factor BamB
MKLFARLFVGRLILFLIPFLTSASGKAGDWPQFLGPNRNGTSAGEELADSWPKEGPSVVWQKPIGQGFSGPAVAAGKLIVFHRLEDQEVLECLECKSGKVLWTYKYPTSYHDDFGFDEGPRATPAIADGRAYTYGAEGVLSCVSMENGANLWTVKAMNQFHAPKGFFGIACSPLVEGNHVLLNVGGQDGAGIVAFDKNTGKISWKATSEEASYSSPVTATVGGRRYAFLLTRSALVTLDPANGKIFSSFSFRPRIRSSVSAATPLIIGDLIFVSASYGTGAALLKFKEAGPEQLWAQDEALSSHYATSVHHAGFLYGIHGRVDPGFAPGASLRCVELSSGKVRWEQKSFGAAVLTLVKDQLLILTEKGELIGAPASAEGFSPKARAQILSSQTRAHPALADGFFYARDKTKLICVDLRKQK